MKIFTIIIFLLCAVLLSAQTPAERLLQLFEQDQAFLKKEFYETEAPFPSVAEADELRRADFYQQELAQLRAIDPTLLQRKDRVSYELFGFILQERITETEYGAYLVPLNAEGGWYTDFALEADGWRPQTADDYRRLLHARTDADDLNVWDLTQTAE